MMFKPTSTFGGVGGLVLCGGPDNFQASLPVSVFSLCIYIPLNLQAKWEIPRNTSYLLRYLLSPESHHQLEYMELHLETPQ